MTVGLGGCVTNNGDIGIWYGVWALDAIEIDGQPDDTWQQPDSWTNFSFQNDIVYVARVNDLQDELNYSWGTWSQDGNTLTLNFSHSSDDPSQSGRYLPPSWIFIDRPVTSFTLDSADARNVVMTTTDDDGRRITYHLRKTY